MLPGCMKNNDISAQILGGIRRASTLKKKKQKKYRNPGGSHLWVPLVIKLCLYDNSATDIHINPLWI